MATNNKNIKPTPVKRVTSPKAKEKTTKVSETQKVEAASVAAKKPTKTTKVPATPKAKPVSRVETKKTEEVKKQKEENKKTVVKKVPTKKVDTTKPVLTATETPSKSATKTVYHVTKRDNNGREWKVFIQGSNKVIKLFNTQAEALQYAKELCANKNDGSYVMLHGLDGKIRRA